MNTEKLLKLLNENEVKYVIIGASAFPVHGYVRATLDIDIFIDNSIENAKRTKIALEQFGYNLTEINETDLLETKILIRQYSVETDIHPFVKGITFDEVWKNKVEASYKTAKVYFAGLNSLIKMKKAANRPKDIEDLKYLERLKTRKNKLYQN